MSRRLMVYAGVALVVAGCKTAPVFTPPAGSYTGLPATIEGVTGQRTIASVDSTFFGSNRPLLGRLFLSREYSGDGPVAVLSHAFWVERFGGNPAVVGTDVEVDGVARTLVGIMPEGVDVPRGVALWIPRGGNSLDQETQEVSDDPARPSVTSIAVDCASAAPLRQYAMDDHRARTRTSSDQEKVVLGNRASFFASLAIVADLRCRVTSAEADDVLERALEAAREAERTGGFYESARWWGEAHFLATRVIALLVEQLSAGT